MKRTAKNECPYCHSQNVGLDMRIEVKAYLEDAAIKLDTTSLMGGGSKKDAEKILDAGDMGGFCKDCGKLLEVERLDPDGIVYAVPDEKAGRRFDRIRSAT